MFVQVHILQSMPPGNLNRDETGQPKKCVFGGVTRGRISSQCLKRNIRLSQQFKEAFGDALADRTQYLPQMVADELKGGKLGVPDDELAKLMAAIAAKFKKEGRGSDSGEADDGEEEEGPVGSLSTGDGAGKTPQLVFFPPPFASHIAELVADLRQRNPGAYNRFIGRKARLSKDDAKALDTEIDKFVSRASEASKKLTVDIGLFGRMTTSDLVLNVEAACQVAHAISTHETLIESDYLTTMDDRKRLYATTQTEQAAAAFLSSTQFFNSAVYYKYLNLDVDALRKHLPVGEYAMRAAGVLVNAAALSNPTGKQNSFANLSVPELILVEITKSKRPISYANAFLQPVEGRNLMTESAEALSRYIDSVATAYTPKDVRRLLLAVGPASVPLKSDHRSVGTLDELVESVNRIVNEGWQAHE